MRNVTSNDPSLVISYLRLRQTIGAIGLLTPIVVRVGALLTQGVGVISTGSISAYYYTNMHDIFISALVLTGVLMACYRSDDEIDTYLSVATGVAAIGIAIFPMHPESSPAIKQMGLDLPCRSCYLIPAIDHIHYIFAAAFFLLCFYLVYFRFRANTPVQPTSQKIERNRIYQICGLVILASSILIAILALVSSGAPIFWPETAAVIAFGIAWLVKGQTILKDPPLLRTE